MVIEKILKTSAALGIALGIAASSTYGIENFKSKESCEASIEKITVK